MLTFEIIGWAATILALAGAWLNNKRMRICFALWIASNALTFSIHSSAGMWAMAARDAAFFAMAIHGWWLWWVSARGKPGGI